MSCFKNAKWISYDHLSVSIGDRRVREKSAGQLLRKEFVLKKKPKQAKLFITGLGYYVAYINGQEVTDTVLNPAFTNYEKTVLYQVYDINTLTEGRNVIAVSLGNGFYNPATLEVWNYINASWRDQSKLILRLTAVYEDGTEETVCSDSSFRGIEGPVVFNAIRNGTVYDARLEPTGWTEVGFDDSGWNQAVIVSPAPGVLKEQKHLPIKVMKEYSCSVNKISDTLWVFDAGVNTSGWAKISFTAPVGTEISMQYGERLYDSGRLDTEIIAVFSMTGDFQKDTYIAKGRGTETFCSQFAYHGFRYIEVCCKTGIPEDFRLVVQEVRSAMEERGHFLCSDEMVNAIQAAALQATKTNMHGMPTDCPHREKNGWTGDAQLSAEQALLNLNPMSIYRKWMGDFIDAQRPSGQLPGIIPSPGWGYNWGSGPAWDSAIVEIPYMQYLYCGETEILEKMYEPIKKYIAYMNLMAEDNICCFGLGDWCPPKSAPIVCDTALTDTAYFYYDTKRTAEIAEILGYPEDAAYYAGKAQEIKKEFRKRFLKNPKTAELAVPACQTAYGCILYQGLLEEGEEEAFVNALVQQILADGKKTTSGILGAKYVYQVLCRYGKADLVYEMITTKEYPSLGNMIARGATTLWEDFEGGNSLNHHMFGDISAVFYKYFAGIQPDPVHPGFSHIVFAPQFVESLSFAEASHSCKYGEIRSRWQREGKDILLELTVPQGSTAELVLPKGYSCEGKSGTIHPGTVKMKIQIPG